MTARFLVADVFDGLNTLEDGSVDLVITSPPFLALRSYLPADHPDKGKEIGSESTPAEFIDTMLRVTAELRRVLAPHGSIAIELGDTYAGSGGAGGDYNENGLRDGQEKFVGSARRRRNGWPLSKSLCAIPESYRWALIYGRNPFTGQDSPAGMWRVRNDITWARPNPPVGALGDKWRPATSDVVVACTSAKRYWDDLATRKPFYGVNAKKQKDGWAVIDSKDKDGIGRAATSKDHRPYGNATGAAPLLDYWVIPPTGYSGSHYAVYPPALVEPLVKAMCPPKVCRTCGEPSRRILKQEPHAEGRRALANHIRQQREAKGLTQKQVAAHFPSVSGGMTGCVWNWENDANVPTAEQWSILVDLLDLSDEFARLIEGTRQWTESLAEYEPQSGPGMGSGHLPEGVNPAGRGFKWHEATRVAKDAGFTDCGHDNWRPGVILDPFAGSGTTLLVATGHGHDAVGIDIDERNAELALERVGPFLLEVEA